MRWLPLVLVVLVGCSQAVVEDDAAKPAQASPDYEIATDGTKIESVDEEGNRTTLELEYSPPVDALAGLEYPGWDIEEDLSGTVTTDQYTSDSITFTTDDNPSQVADFYAVKWDGAQTNEAEGVYIVTYDEDGINWIVTVQVVDNHTQATLTKTSKQE